MTLSEGTYLGPTSTTVETEGLRFATTYYEPSQKQVWHTHENPTFFIPIRGEYADCAPYREFVEPALSVMFHPTTTPHRCRVGPAGLTGLNVDVTKEWLAGHGLSEADLGSHRPSLGQLAQRRSLNLLESLLIHRQSEVGSLWLETLEPFVAVAEKSEPRPPVWLRQIAGMIEAEFAQPYSLRTLADRAGVHPVYFARAFRRSYGRSLSERVQELRVSHAIALILEGSSAGEAAIEAGFSDQFHFARCCRRHAGITPELVKKIGRAAMVPIVHAS